MNAVAPRSHLVPIGEIALMLAGQIEGLCRELLPGGRRSGAEWVCGSLLGEAGTQLAVHLQGIKAGVWKDFRADVAGDALDLVAQIRFRGDKRLALQWSRRWLGLDVGDPAAIAAVRRDAAARQEAAQDEGEREIEATRRLAHRRWLEAQDGVLGTPVELYLAGRGIDLAGFARVPRAIRFHPGLFCQERQARLPAMVTAIACGGKFVAVHRTWLEQAGPGDWRKARLECPKKVMGRFAGGYISLWRGASGRPLGEAVAGEHVAITEGIEDGLSVAMARPERRVLAVVSLSNLSAVVLPPAITGVRIWRQNDTKRAAIDAFDRALSSLLARGLEVFVVDVPVSGKDVNDLLRGDA